MIAILKNERMAEDMFDLGKTPDGQAYWHGYHDGLVNAGLGTVNKFHDVIKRDLKEGNALQRARAKGYFDGLEWEVNKMTQSKFFQGDLAAALRDITDAVEDQDWDRLEAKANELAVLARIARKTEVEFEQRTSNQAIIERIYLKPPLCWHHTPPAPESGSELEP